MRTLPDLLRRKRTNGIHRKQAVVIVREGTNPLNKLTERKTRLIFETPCLLRGRPLIVHVEAWGLRLREKRRTAEFEISWAQVHNRAAEIAADRLRQARRERKQTH